MALAVFAFVLAGALLGSFVGKKLPAHHLSDSSKEVVKFGAGFIGTMAALVLGLLVASAKSSYDAKVAEVQQASAKIILIDAATARRGIAAVLARAHAVGSAAMRLVDVRC